MRIIFLILLSTMVNVEVTAQTVIKMKREGGVSKVPCKVNGLSLSFIFDTGASEVSISLTEARFMFKNGYLMKSDILGTANFMDANGDISEGVTINLKEIEIGGLKLYNVRASIVKNSNAPLLMGQSAISKLGIVQIDLATNTLTILKSSTSQRNDYTPNNSVELERVDNKSLKLGNQIWTNGNLNVTRFRNGEKIPIATTLAEWISADKLNKAAMCYFENNSALGMRQGALYNWYAVNDPRGLAPNGWRIASGNDWTILCEYLKQFSSVDYGSFNFNEALKKVNFDLIPTGCRIPNTFNFHHGEAVYWWTSTSYEKTFAYEVSTPGWTHGNPLSGSIKGRGAAVRCVK